uniref:LicD family protein n=1 Tax=Candidatus Kentrum sp. TUN TaxID=2126343 RepID=A0A450ZHQ2_9GAMM|nr:MAG: LicD family protein [Candidatus Kentron sp. TUN]VFK53258.1 MAG: LicD family protein [Candidatus Kentron sp. TUN]
MVSLLVRNVRAVLEKEKIPYRLDFGTLLGAVRGGDIISWDDDWRHYHPAKAPGQGIPCATNDIGR